jgi:hypothetical protein
MLQTDLGWTQISWHEIHGFDKNLFLPKFGCHVLVTYILLVITFWPCKSSFCSDDYMQPLGLPSMNSVSLEQPNIWYELNFLIEPIFWSLWSKQARIIN